MIITSMLDTDAYKFSMAQVVLHKYPSKNVKYKFKLRSHGVDLGFLADDIRKEVDHLCTLRFTTDELEYLNSIDYLTSDFIEYLRLLSLNPNYINIVNNNDTLEITVEGPWISTIWFEVPVLAIVNELYFKYIVDATGDSLENVNTRSKRNVIEKSVKFNDNPGIKFADFGTRRRFSKKNQKNILLFLKKNCSGLVGTSNVYFAKLFDLKPIGTMAHEFLQAHQQFGRVIDSQKNALEVWSQEYRGKLGIALSDVVGMNAFLRDFDLYFAKLFDGCRHDSGNAYDWCDKLIAHYKKLGLDPMTKTAVFSDGLTVDTVIGLYNEFNGKINMSFGIGTNLTNDVGFSPLQIVMKMVECDGKPVAKISDSYGKGMCEDKQYSEYLKLVFKIEPDRTVMNALTTEQKRKRNEMMKARQKDIDRIKELLEEISVEEEENVVVAETN